MATEKLTALQVTKAKPGRYYDGGGLELLVRPLPDNPTKAGPRFWVLRAMIHGKRREWGLGSGKSVSLAQAREKAKAYHALIDRGIDPADDKRQQAAALQAKAQQGITFEAAARQAWEAKRSGFRNAKHRAQWISTLETYAFPVIGRVPVGRVNKDHVASVLTQPVEGGTFWLARNETASRVYQRISHVLNWAISNDARADPAPPKATMANILPSLPDEPERHHAAMPYGDVPAFYQQLMNEPATMGRLALRFAMLTATRSGEVRGALWSEIDFAKARWTIPAGRMKATKEHVVPLSGAALGILRLAKLGGGDGYIFPGNRDKPLSDMTISKVLRARGLAYTVHGFRSSFREWAGETTDYPREVIEHALAHQLADKAEAAYQRGSLLPKRATLMDDWADYLTPSVETAPYCVGVIATFNQPPEICAEGISNPISTRFHGCNHKRGAIASGDISDNTMTYKIVG